MKRGCVTGVAQLVEQWSPKPKVVSSNLTTRAIVKSENMSAVVNFVKESFDEMKHKVSWPKYSQLQSSSILVLIGSLLFALLIGIMDFAFKNGMEWFYQSM